VCFGRKNRYETANAWREAYEETGRDKVRSVESAQLEDLPESEWELLAFRQPPYHFHLWSLHPP